MRRQFHPLSADLDDATETLAKLKGIPSLVAPVTGNTEVDSDAAPVQRTARDEDGGAYMKNWCPDYLHDELSITSIKRKVTINYLILEALRHSGYTIADKDMVQDGRRRPRKLG